MEEKKYRCSRCDALVGENDKICPNCGLDYESDEPVEESISEFEPTSDRSFNGCQISAILVGILGFVGGIILACQGFGVVALIVSWLLTFITAVFMYGFGEIINNTRDIKENSKNIYELLKESRDYDSDSKLL